MKIKKKKQMLDGHAARRVKIRGVKEKLMGGWKHESWKRRLKMRIVIDITEEQFALMKLMARNQHYRGELTVEQAIAHGIVLPENVTNGDMFKALFPNYTYVGVCVLDENECILLHDVNYHWWNAPYESERENEE